MTDAVQWFYAAGTDHKGPFSADEMRELLATGALQSETLVWSAGLSTWTPLQQTMLAPPLIDLPVAPPVLAPSDSFIGSILDGLLESVKYCFLNYATFVGRSGRAEFWYFILFNIITGSSLAVVGDFLLKSGGGMIYFVYFGLVALPVLAVLVRRLHDTNRSGLLALLLLAPLVGGVILTVFCCLRGTPGRNRFG
ncbi:DUF805 domain-containing protein [Segnochrobactraceae bacterium EtOH-i3]